MGERVLLTVGALSKAAKRERRKEEGEPNHP